MEKSNDCFGTCPRCGEMGWCHYKGKATILNGTGTPFKVSIYKCRKCGKKFGFNLSDDIPEPKTVNKKEEDVIDAIFTTKDSSQFLHEIDALMEISKDYDLDPALDAYILVHVAKLTSILTSGRGRVSNS